MLWIALAKAEDTFVCALTRDNLLETKPEVFTLASFDPQLPVLACVLMDLEHQFSFTCCMETEVEIVANGPAIHFCDSVAGLQLEFGSQTHRSHFGDRCRVLVAGSRGDSQLGEGPSADRVQLAGVLEALALRLSCERCGRNCLDVPFDTTLQVLHRNTCSYFQCVRPNDVAQVATLAIL